MMMFRRRRCVILIAVVILIITSCLVCLSPWLLNHAEDIWHLVTEELVLRKHHGGFTQMTSQDKLLQETQVNVTHSIEKAESRNFTLRNRSNQDTQHDEFMKGIIKQNIKENDAYLQSTQPRPTISIIPQIYVITPTFWRLEQKAELTQIANALRGTPRLHWIVIEDSVNRTELVTHFLQNCKVNYTHLFSPTPTGEDIMRLYKVSKFDHKGVLQRNEGLDWIIQNAEFPSVLYFADDDNTYDPRIFEEIRYTQKVSVFPVGLVGRSVYEAPVVKSGKVIGWITSIPNRKFPVDMASFAVNTEFYIEAGKPTFNIVTKMGTIENGFLKDLHISQTDLEPKADNCTKILVWHTKTKKTSISDKPDFENSRRKYSQSPLEV